MQLGERWQGNKWSLNGVKLPLQRHSPWRRAFIIKSSFDAEKAQVVYSISGHYVIQVVSWPDHQLYLFAAGSCGCGCDIEIDG